jgi:hypothetical protein
MRSSDAWFGLPYDVPFFRWLHLRMLTELRDTTPGLDLGALRLQLDSLHVYEGKLDAAKRYLARWRPAPRWVNPVPLYGDLGTLKDVALRCLADLRAEEVAEHV